MLDLLCWAFGVGLSMTGLRCRARGRGTRLASDACETVRTRHGTTRLRRACRPNGPPAEARQGSPRRRPRSPGITHAHPASPDQPHHPNPLSVALDRAVPTASAVSSVGPPERRTRLRSAGTGHGDHANEVSWRPRVAAPRFLRRPHSSASPTLLRSSSAPSLAFLASPQPDASRLRSAFRRSMAAARRRCMSRDRRLTAAPVQRAAAGLGAGLADAMRHVFAARLAPP